MNKGKSILQLNKSVISSLDGRIVQGGRVTTDQDTMKYCDLTTDDTTSTRPMSLTNCTSCFP